MSERMNDALEAVIDKFWDDNAELRRQILRDLYAHGRVLTKTNEAGRAAVDNWLVFHDPARVEQNRST